MNEFLDAYSDDQIYLEMIERLVNSHPTEANVPDYIKYSSFTRLWIVMMVGSIEMMIKQWAIPNPHMQDIASYFDSGSNEERINKLHTAFINHYLPIDKKYFEDFLACKYIRNAYVHGEWNENQKPYVLSKNFPTDIMRFDKSHFERSKASYYTIMNALGMVNAASNLKNN